MRAAMAHTRGAPLRLVEVPTPTPTGEEVLVRVRGAGVCHSDLRVTDDGLYPLPLILGHEIAGEVDGVGEVVVSIPWGCRRCRMCRFGIEGLCAEWTAPGFQRPGGYAEAVIVPSRDYLVPLEGLDPVAAAPLADAGATSYRALSRLRRTMLPGGRILIIGIGGLGQFAIQWARLLTDATVIAVDIHASKRTAALELGAAEAVAPEELEGRFDGILDLVGTDETLALAARSLERHGSLVLVGGGAGSLRFSFELPRESTWTTTVGSTRADLESVVAHARRGEVSWNIETLPLERAEEALRRLRDGTVVGRLVLTP